jgi:hypothetical protein
MDLMELSRIETEFWNRVFDFHVNEGESVERAEELAWLALDKAFPETT